MAALIFYLSCLYNIFLVLFGKNLYNHIPKREFQGGEKGKFLDKVKEIDHQLAVIFMSGNR